MTIRCGCNSSCWRTTSEPVYETEEHTRLLRLARKRLELAEQHHAMVLENSEYSDERNQLKAAASNAAAAIHNVDTLIRLHPHDDTLVKLTKPLRARAQEVLISSLLDKASMEYVHGQFRYASVDAKRVLGLDPTNVRAEAMVQQVDTAMRVRLR